MKRLFAVLLLVFSSLGQAATTTQVGPIVSNVVAQLTDGANISMDASVAYTFAVTIGGNHTLDNPTNQVAGGLYALLNTIGAGGGHVLSFGNAWRFPDAIKPVGSTAEGSLDVYLFVSDGSNMNYISLQKNIANPVATPTSVAVDPDVEKCTVTWVNNAVGADSVNVYQCQEFAGPCDPVPGTGGSGLVATLGPTETSYEHLLPGETGLTHEYTLRAQKGATLSPISSLVSCLVE